VSGLCPLIGKADSDSATLRTPYGVNPCDCYSGSKPFPNATLDSIRLTISRSLLEKPISVKFSRPRSNASQLLLTWLVLEGRASGRSDFE
jgi:hypothetical protein